MINGRSNDSLVITIRSNSVYGFGQFPDKLIPKVHPLGNERKANPNAWRWKLK